MCEVCICMYWNLTPETEGQALGYSVRSTIPAPHENVAVQVLGNLLCPTNQGCRLSALSFLPHHHYIRTDHTYLIPLNTINMTPPKPPVQNPVDIPFENGSFTDHKCYPTWWLSNVDLQNVLDSLWDSFEPDTDRIVGNAHLLFSIKKPNGLPYHHPTDGTQYFFVTSLPDSRKPQVLHPRIPTQYY